MAPKVLTPEEAAAEGLPRPGRVISAQEAAAEGLPAPAKGRTLFDESDPGILPTMGHQFLQGFAKMGGDEIVGAMSAGIPKSMGQDREGWDAYRRGRELERQKLDDMWRHHPKVSLAMNLAGDMSSDALAALMGANVLSPKYQTAAGAVRGLNSSEAELTPDRVTPGDVASAGLSTLAGAGIGYGASKLPGAPAAARRGLGKLGEKIESTAVGGRIADSQLAKWFEEAADAAGQKISDTASGAAKAVADKVGPILRAPGELLEKAAIATGRRVLSGAKGLKAEEALSDEAVREAMRSGAIQFLGTTKGASKRLTALRERLGPEYEALISSLKEKGVQGPEVQRLADEWLGKAIKKEANSLGSDIPDMYLQKADEVLKKAPGGRLDLDQAVEITRDLQKQAKYGKLDETLKNRAKRDLASDMRRSIEGEVDSAAETSSDPVLRGLADRFRPVKSRLGKIIDADDHAFDETQRIASRRQFGLQDVLAGSATFGATQNPVKTAAAVIGSQLVRTRGPSTFAWTTKHAADKYLSALDHAPQIFGEFGAVLAREKSPDVRLAMTEAMAEAYPKFAEMLDQFKQRLTTKDSTQIPEASRGP